MNKYYFVDNSQKQCGPFAPADLKSQFISPTTLVWCTGMPDWVPAQTVEELQFLFDTNAPQPIPKVETYQQQQPAYNTQYNNQGQRGALDGTLPMPKNWLVESILVTVLCCLPFGIAGILSANKVESRYNMGDYDGAMQASKDAAKWTKLGFFISLIGIILYFILIAVLATIGGGY